MEHPAAATGTAAGCHKQRLTTFVQTGTNTFREVVQRLTGPSESSNATPKTTTNKTICNKSKTTSKLHERRQYMRPKLEIVKPNFHLKNSNSTDQLHHHYLSPNSKSPNSAGLLNSTTVITPSGILAKVSLLEDEKKSADITKMQEEEEEEKAIKESRFY